MRLKTIIVDDEQRSIALLQEYLKAYEAELELAGKANEANEAFKLIREVRMMSRSTNVLQYGVWKVVR